jgi:hypothetical protein
MMAVCVGRRAELERSKEDVRNIGTSSQHPIFEHNTSAQ